MCCVAISGSNKSITRLSAISADYREREPRPFDVFDLPAFFRETIDRFLDFDRAVEVVMEDDDAPWPHDRPGSPCVAINDLFTMIAVNKAAIEAFIARSQIE